jgi:Uma2 family endonuclease
MTAHLPISTSPQAAKLTARDFWLLADAGAFAGFVKTELIEGELRVVNAVHSRHALAHATLTVDLGVALREAGLGLKLLSTPSTQLSEDSIPEPDLAIATRADGKALAAVDVVLAIEISDTTLGEDLGLKASLYGRHGIPEYWVVDVEGRIIHQHWAPNDQGYGERQAIMFGESISSILIAGLTVETARLD